MFRIAIITVGVLLTSTAFAQQPSYNYLQGAWQTVDLDAAPGINVDGDELSISGAFEISDDWHIVASYASTDLDFGVDLDRLKIGAGYHTDIGTNSSAFAELMFVQADASVNGFGSLDDSGIGARAGIRGYVTDAIELAGALSYVDLGNDADGTSFEGEAWYSVSRTFSVGLLASFHEDITTYGIGGRVYF